MIKDSGNRKQFDSGAVRDVQEGKGRCDLLPLDVVAFLYDNFFEDDTGKIFTSIAMFQQNANVWYLARAVAFFLDQSEYGSWSHMFLEVAKHFEEGAKKYGERNWEKGLPVSCYINSGIRHLLKFYRGDNDERHDRAFVWNMMCAIWTAINKPELNEYRKDEDDA